MLALAAPVLLTFVCGVAYEACSTFWVHNAERGRALPASAFSMLQAVVILVGIEQSIHSLACAGAYVIGYGTGTFVAIRVKARRERAV